MRQPRSGGDREFDNEVLPAGIYSEDSIMIYKVFPVRPLTDKPSLTEGSVTVRHADKLTNHQLLSQNYLFLRSGDLPTTMPVASTSAVHKNKSTSKLSSIRFLLSSLFVCVLTLAVAGCIESGCKCDCHSYDNRCFHTNPFFAKCLHSNDVNDRSCSYAVL